MSIALLVQAPP
ncbi:hypothetical protein D022_1539A, partial [Vibrio parahaemolyticus 12310]